MTNGDPCTVSKEMAVTHEEFRRGFARLDPAVTAAWQDAGGPVFRLPWAGGEIEVRLEAESTRRLGMLSMPCTRVTLVFKDITADEIETFIARFDRRFQRGGG